MRTEKEMMSLIVGTAEEDERIRAVVMNGSRTNPRAPRDCFQDYDIVYVVRDLPTFTKNHQWIQQFGEIMIMQMPEDMSLIPPDNNGVFVYLMQFTDGNRIDLTLVPEERAGELISYDHDSLSIILLDKDHLLKPFPTASDRDYWVQPPTAKQFADCCNEFWWVSPYVAKGLWREELSYAKETMDIPVRNMLMKMLEWQIGIATEFSVSAGKSGKYFKHYLDEQTWEQFVQTYPNGEYDNIWKALFVMGDLFRTSAQKVAAHFDYQYPEADDARVTAHLHHVHSLPKDAKAMY
ncbi:aminoglycoside 6-adenylyltransferase [Bacillus sp. SD088]|uniref:aminoglycoside 6-adenylyltransferase n=1 Tax=Bacillus sp. SD088 TaxID=2782012 RepID=UPI001A95DA5C|nr:aminoglycoside 6-adenylyltransferase [Bacillus sp. SD088]MBO0995886.1 aminoglycoside 6-adenylyltransferase [Bacillus sp. SD088]